MTELKRFTALVHCEYGGVHPEAEIVVRKCKFANEGTLESRDAVFPYESALNVNNLAYQLSYHLDQHTRAQGKRLRPLFYEVVGQEDKLSDVFVVDLNLPSVIAALSGDGDSQDKLLNAVEADFRNKYN